MDRLLFLIFCLGMGSILIAQKLQLSAPKSNLEMVMIEKAKPVWLHYDFRMVGATIHYTLDGSTPTKKSKKFVKKIRVQKPCVVKARAFHPDFEPSDVVTSSFIEGGKKMVSYDVSLPHQSYSDQGSLSLFDGRFGDSNFKKGYLGFDKGLVTINLKPDSKIALSQINFSCLINQGAWIFGPKSVKIYDKNQKLIANKTFDEFIIKSNPNHLILTLDIPKSKYESLNIVIEPQDKIPEWHDGKGLPAWLFMDEVWVR